MYELDYKGPRRVGYQPAQLPHCHSGGLLREITLLDGLSVFRPRTALSHQLPLVSGAVITITWVTPENLPNKP